VKDTNIDIWQRSNGRAAMMIFWILTASYVFSGQLIPGVF
tara:strand:- start:288 stop:407 length:120 start_codon:yes stop_codon:yes gene_type:complete